MNGPCSCCGKEVARGYFTHRGWQCDDCYEKAIRREQAPALMVPVNSAERAARSAIKSNVARTDFYERNK